MLLAVVWRDKLRTLGKWGYKGTMLFLALSLIMVLPRYGYNNNDRVRLIYQDKNGNPTTPPLTHYLFNVFFPEEEICNMGITGAILVPRLGYLNGRMLNDFKRDVLKGRIINFYKPYNRLNWSRTFAMSGVVSQMANMFGSQFGIEGTRSVYVIEPKDYDKNKTYPVVFFMHGYLGNWKLYTGVLKDLKNCIIVCVGTKDLSGIFNTSDITFHLNRQIPFLRKLGYKIDDNNLHLIGLSNGGTACNSAYNSFSNKFKSITYISTGISQTYPIKSKVLLIGGGKDLSSGTMQGAYKKLKANGVKTELFWAKDEGHFVLVNKRKEIVDFLNKNLPF